MAWYSTLLEQVFGVQKEIERRVSLAVRALDDPRDTSLSGGNTRQKDRYPYDREEILRDALLAWRTNPLANRIVSLKKEYVIGEGVQVTSDHAGTQKFIKELLAHELNDWYAQLLEWVDELTRAGEIFILITTDAGGMSYFRAVSAMEIADVLTKDEDIRQPIVFIAKTLLTETEGKRYAAYDQADDQQNEDGSFPAVMLQLAINRVVGGKRGESDLGSLLRWLARFSNWLEDRVRLNRFRQAFMFWLKKPFGSESERKARELSLNANPPQPGSILVSDASEDWNVIHPKLDSFEASEDGQAIKKMIAVGSGNPMHFLAEPEGSTRTTAEQSGGPTYRHYSQRQVLVFGFIRRLVRVAVRRRAMLDHQVKADAGIEVTGVDISARDNAALAVAANTIIQGFMQLRTKQMIDDEEMLRLSYKFAGEIVDVKELLARGRLAPPILDTGIGKGTAPAIQTGIQIEGVKQPTQEDATAEGT